MRLSQVMSRRVQTVPSTLSAWEAWALMQRLKIHHLVVEEQGEIAGLVSDADIGGRCGAAVRAGTTVGLLMTPHFTAAAPGDSVRDAALRMQAGHLSCLLVISRGRLVGIVTLTDLLGVLTHTALDERGSPARSRRRAARVQ